MKFIYLCLLSSLVTSTPMAGMKKDTNRTAYVAENKSVVLKGTSDKSDVKVDYYTKKYVDNKTFATTYELHGNFYINNIDTSKWSATATNTVSARIGLYQANTAVDWMLLKFSKTGDKLAYTCEDGFSNKGSKVYSKDSAKMSNCMTTEKKSKWEAGDSKEGAELKIHFMRPFDSGVVANDLKLEVGTYKTDYSV